MSQKINLGLTILVIIFFSGCTSPDDDVNPLRIAPIILVENSFINEAQFKPGESVSVKIGFMQFKGEDFDAIPNLKTEGTVVNPSGTEYPLPITKAGDNISMREYFKYITSIPNTDTEGTYTIKISASAGKNASALESENFVIGTPSRLQLNLSSKIPHRFSSEEKERIKKTIEYARAEITMYAKLMGENASAAEGIVNPKPEGITEVIAEISTDTGAPPSIKRPAFTGEMIILNNTKINIPSDGYDTWKYIETKDNKAYYSNTYFLPLVGDYEFTVLVSDATSPSTYLASENATTRFSLR